MLPVPAANLQPGFQNWSTWAMTQLSPHTAKRKQFHSNFFHFTLKKISAHKFHPQSILDWLVLTVSSEKWLNYETDLQYLQSLQLLQSTVQIMPQLVVLPSCGMSHTQEEPADVMSSIIHLMIWLPAASSTKKGGYILEYYVCSVKLGTGFVHLLLWWLYVLVDLQEKRGAASAKYLTPPPYIHFSPVLCFPVWTVWIYWPSQLWT